MKRLYYLVSLLAIIGIIFWNCQQTEGNPVDVSLEDQTEDGSFDKPVVIEYTYSDDIEDIYNPCTGQRTDVHLTANITMRRLSIPQAGRVHYVFDWQYEVVQDDGFSGTAIGPEIYIEGDEGQPINWNNLFLVTVTNTSGQKVKLHLNIHYTLIGNELTSYIENFNNWCAGH